MIDIVYILNQIDNVMYFPILIIVMAAAGLYFTLRTRGVQVRLFPESVRLLFDKSEGYDSIRLDCFTENPYSRKLYEKAGYSVVGYADWRKGRFELREKKL